MLFSRVTIILVLIIFAGIVLLPLFVLIAEALSEAVGGSVFMFGTREAALLGNSLLIAAATSAAAVVVGVAYALCVSRINLPGRKVFLFAAMAPLFLPPQIMAVGWLRLTGSEGLNLPIAFHGQGAVIFVLTLAFFPFVTVLAMSGLHSLDSRLEEAGNLCRSRAAVLQRITLPLISPYVASGALLVFLFSLTDYGVADLLRVNTYPVELFVQFSAFYNTGKTLWLSLPLIFLTLGLTLLIGVSMARRSFVTITSTRIHPVAIEGTGWRVVGTMFCGLVLLFSIVLPFASLIWGAGPPASYAKALHTAKAQIGQSIFSAGIAATLMAVLSLPLAYCRQRMSGKLRLLIDVAMIIPFAVPAAVFGAGLVLLWNRPLLQPVYQSFAIVVLGYIARFSAFYLLVLNATIGQLHKNLEEAAVLACSSRKRILGRILIPLISSGLLAGWLLCFAFCLGEIGTTLLVCPAGEATLPIRIYTLMHYGAHRLVCSLCVILIGIIGMVSAAMLWLHRQFVVRTTAGRI